MTMMGVLTDRVVVTGGGDYATGLINYWPMDDANTNVAGQTVADVFAGNNALWPNVGTVTSAAGPPASSLATARALDGAVGTRLALSTNPRNWNTAGSFSIALWGLVTNNSLNSSAGGGQTFFYSDLVGDGSNYVRISNRITGPGGVYFGTSSTGISTAVTTVVSNTWIHLVGTNLGGGAGGAMNLYSNGVLLATAAQNGDFGAAPGTGVGDNMGAMTSTDGMLTGRLQKVRLYNRALSAADVAALYAAGGG
jgi:hypothetical protein